MRICIYLMIFVFISSIFAAATQTTCLGVNCGNGSGDLGDQLNEQFDRQLVINELLFRERLLEMGLDPGADRMKECVTSCRKEATRRKKICNEVYRWQPFSGLGLCLRAVGEWEYECLDPSGVNCQ